MSRAKVTYQGGESRKNPGQAVDYMLAEVEGVELYAETPPGEGETDSYETLRSEIAKQAREHGITLDKLEFAYEEDLVCEKFACPKCGERRMDYLVNYEGHVTCGCGYEYDIEHLTFTVKNPWSGELVEVPESGVTQAELDALAILMDDDIREAIHNSSDCPTPPGAFFRKYAEIVGAEEAGKIWFA